MRLALETEVRFGTRTRAKRTMTLATTPHRAVVRKTLEKPQAAIAIAPRAGPIAHPADQRARNAATPRSVVASLTWSRCPLAMANNCGKAAALVPSGRQAIRRRSRYCTVMVSAISQNRPGIIEIKGLKTSHFKESKTAPLDWGEIGSMGHVECPQSEPANNNIQPSRSRMVAATNSERVWDQSRNGGAVFAVVKTGRYDCRV